MTKAVEILEAEYQATYADMEISQDISKPNKVSGLSVVKYISQTYAGFMFLAEHVRRSLKP